MSTIAIKQLRNTGTPDTCISFDGTANVWRKMNHVMTFTTADLDANNILLVNHTLARKYVNVVVYDDQDTVVQVDSIKAIDGNNVQIDLTSQVANITTWNASVI